MMSNLWREDSYTSDVIERELSNQVGLGGIAEWHRQCQGGTVRLVVLNNGDHIYLRGIREAYVFVRALEQRQRREHDVKYALFVRTNEIRVWKYEGGTEDKDLAWSRAKEIARVEGRGNVRLFDLESGRTISLPK